VGFLTVKEAKEAKGHFDQTFIDTSKIKVAYALPVC
jgi:hypothetical protein